MKLTHDQRRRKHRKLMNKMGGGISKEWSERRRAIELRVARKNARIRKAKGM